MALLPFQQEAKQEAKIQQAYHSIVEDEVDKIAALLQAGLNPDAIAKNEIPLLILSIRYKRVKILQLFLKSGAEVNKPSKNGATALWHAAYGGDYQCAKELVDYGADVNMAREDGETPLHAAAGNGRTEVMKLLLSKGANVNSAMEDGKTPLMRVHDAPGKQDNVKLILRAGAHLEARDKNGRTALMLAIGDCRTSKVEALLEAGADVNAVSWMRETPLAIAQSRSNCADIERLLIEKGAK